MNIEQTLASVAPAQETKLESFENYNDAYDYSRKSGSCGLIILEDNQGDLPLNSVFTELSRAYKARGWPAFGIIYHSKGVQLDAKRLQVKDKSIFDYVDASTLTDNSKAHQYLDELWQQYINAFQAHIAPTTLLDTLRALGRPHLTLDSEVFRDRILTTLSAELNLTWLEIIAIKLEPLFNAATQANPDSTAPHQVILQMLNVAKPLNLLTIQDIAQSKAPLAQRLATIVLLLDQARQKNCLEAILSDSGRLAKPGVSALIRHLAKARDTVRTIAADTANSNNLRNVGTK